VDWLFFAVMGGGLGVLAAAARRRAATTRRRIARLGMSPRADLTRVPVELQHTALWTLCEGGTERSVVGGRLSLAAHDVDVTCFDLEDLRRKAFEWAWLDVATPFRLHTPLSVVACTLPRTLPHVLVKRAGPADRIEPRAGETGGRPLASAADGVLVEVIASGVAARAAARLVEMRPFAVEPPATLARDTTDVPLEPGWRAWSDPSAGDAARHLLAALGAGLEDTAHDRELVIETRGPLLVAYVASGGPLAAHALEDLVDAAALACERVLAATPDLDPRGVSG
jgi:hypothetical protein